MAGDEKRLGCLYLGMLIGDELEDAQELAEDLSEAADVNGMVTASTYNTLNAHIGSVLSIMEAAKTGCGEPDTAIMSALKEVQGTLNMMTSVRNDGEFRRMANDIRVKLSQIGFVAEKHSDEIVQSIIRGEFG